MIGIVTTAFTIRRPHQNHSVKIMQRLFVLVLWVCVGSAVVFPQTKPKIAQQATATYPDLGTVRIRVIETPKEVSKLEFYSLRDKQVITSLGIENSELPDEPGPASSFVRFRLATLPGLAALLIFAVHVSPGGSDSTFFAHVIGWKDGKFQVLHEDSIETQTQGGVFIGYLGKKYGYGVATWTFIWCQEEDPPVPSCREAHYDKHRYEINLYPLDTKTLAFKPVVTMQTKRKYAGHGAGALKEFGFHFQDLRQQMPKVREYARD